MDLLAIKESLKPPFCQGALVGNQIVVVGGGDDGKSADTAERLDIGSLIPVPPACLSARPTGLERNDGIDSVGEQGAKSDEAYP
mmetsp:Transcript_900/g.2177  ORF Transcript_900/g.2177 Transcript_900/m.2177 type:complete len:84 (-) Transcript_900:75-326(-)